MLTSLKVLSHQVERPLVFTSAYVSENEGCLGRMYQFGGSDALSPYSTFADVSTFFEHPKPMLRKAELRGISGIVEIMDLFAHQAGGLEHFEPAYEEISPVTFIENNPRLHAIHITRIVCSDPSESQDTAQKKAAEMVESFLKSRKLQQLYVGNGNRESAIPERLWNTLARRGIEFCARKSGEGEW